jgi:DNA-binding MurR/RpiR family transcriptional regulator
MPRASDDTDLPPRDFEALRLAILQRRATLPRRLTQVAAFALDNPDEMAFATAARIAAAAEVQPSTLVRFARQFGLDGFSSLQMLFRERLRIRNASYGERLARLRADEAAMPRAMGILSGFIAAGHGSLDRLAAAIDPAGFEAAIALLAAADTIYLLARRRAYPVASYAAYAFGKLGVKCVATGSAAGIDDDVLAQAGPRDAAFAVSFSPYASETAAQARALAARGVPVVALTDSALSPLADCARVWFSLAEADHAGFRSLSASMAFAMALTVAVAERRGD